MAPAIPAVYRLPGLDLGRGTADIPACGIFTSSLPEDPPLLICGWVPGTGRRAHVLAALVLGGYDGAQLRYAGTVGTGFTGAMSGRAPGPAAAWARLSWLAQAHDSMHDRTHRARTRGIR